MMRIGAAGVLLAGAVGAAMSPAAHAQTKGHHGPGHSAEEAARHDLELLNVLEERFSTPEHAVGMFGHTRQRLTFIDDLAWGEDLRTGDLFYTHRYHLGARIDGAHVRGLIEASAAFDHGAVDADSPVEENRLAVQRAWVEADLIDTGARTLALRVGRDEWRLGSQRLVAVRDGTNVRRRFNGARLFYHQDDWDIQILGGFEAENDPGVLDDDITDNRALWGVYGVGPAPFGLPGRVDVYYLGLDDENGRTVERTGRETRHSVGARLWGARGGWDWNVEGVYQFGRFRMDEIEPGPGPAIERGDISAWTLASIVGYTFEDAPLSPRIALSANVASGDRDPDDGDVTAFNALFPRGSYFSELALLGPRNFYNVNPYLTLNLADGLALITDINLYWRYSIADGIYGPPGNLLFAPAGSTARFVNTSVSCNLEYEVSERLFLGAIYTRSAPENFVRDVNPEAVGIDFVELTFRLDF